MLWADWVRQRGLTWEAAARLIAVSNSTVAYRYTKGSVPRPPIMGRIYLATDGEVTPNDFYRLPKLRRRAAA